eukprot:m.19838 g.19838  ORF g.19838 m.19838 type:complete len:158 (-) comp12633_c0_seq1:26-499(-)
MPVNTPGVITDEAFVNGTIDEVFDFLSDFSNTVIWDPGVVEGKRNEEGPIKVGSTFALMVKSGKNIVPMSYEVVEMDKPKRIVIVGDSSQIFATDIMEFTQLEDGKVKVDYTADLKFKGCLKIFVRLLGGTLNKIGRDAMVGLETHFNGGASSEDTK